jgi:hypothetical protein
MNTKTSHKKQMEALHSKATAKFDEYLSAKKDFKKEEHKKLLQQKDKWQSSWNELMETMLVLERLEI